MKMCRPEIYLAVLLGLSVAPQHANAQSSSGAGMDSTITSSRGASSPHGTPATKAPYRKPTEDRKFRNFLFDSFGPYRIAEAAIGGAITQAKNSPPEWGQGWESYGKRVGSTFGISLVTTTTRYALAEVFREDTIYYRCECSGFFPRLEHALISTVTARRGKDGHRVFSFPSLAAPYAGATTAVLAWYPSRYEPMDGFRLGNYKLVSEAGKFALLEFVYGGPNTLLGKMHHKS